MAALFRTVTIVMILAAGGARSGAQPSVGAAKLKAELEEAMQLNAQVEKLYAEGKYQVAESLNNVAVLYADQGAYGKAEPLLTRAADIREQQLRTDLVSLPEPRKQALMMLLQRNSDSVVSLHADAVPDSTPARELAFTTVLQRKGGMSAASAEFRTDANPVSVAQVRTLDVEFDASPQAQHDRSDGLADGLDRIGLALVGANQGGDGIVTAREIAGFDGWGTRLVVLSACDTGVGAASSGDGVYGLRRALVLAGAASRVVSLWAADDAATRALMREFYGNLARGVGRAEALHQAKLALLHQPQYEHPLCWAPFIAAGDWRPLPEGILTPRESPP